MQSTSPSHLYGRERSNETPSVILAPCAAGYQYVEPSDVVRPQRVAAASSTAAATIPSHDQKGGHNLPHRKHIYDSNKSGQSHYYQIHHRRHELVPQEVRVRQSPNFCSVGSSVPLYATNKTSVRALFPMESDQKPFTSVPEGAAAWSSPADLVLYRLVTLCAECRMHSVQLVELAMRDLAQHVMGQLVTEGDDDERGELLDKWMARLAIPRAVVHVMSTFPRNLALQLDSCRILCHVGKLSLILSPQQCTSTTESVQAVLNCLELHGTESELVKVALGALLHMGAHFPYHEALFDNATLRFLVRDVLCKHLGDSDIQVEVLYLLGNLCCNLALAQAIAHVGGVPAIIDSMHHHWQHAKVSEGGAIALLKLSKWSPSRRRLVWESGGYAALFRASKTHPEGRVGSTTRSALSMLIQIL